MDIVELHHALSDDQQHRLEELILAAVRKQLDIFQEIISDTKDRRDQAQGDDFKEVNDEYNDYVADRGDLLRILGAIAGDNGDGTDPYVDCAAIQRVLNRRRDFYGKPGPHVVDSLLAPIPASTPRRGPGRARRHNWPEFVAEMVRCTREIPINNATDLVKHMSQWCENQWGEQPAASLIWEWITPTVKVLNQLAAAADLASSLPANTA